MCIRDFSLDIQKYKKHTYFRNMIPWLQLQIMLSPNFMGECICTASASTTSNSWFMNT